MFAGALAAGVLLGTAAPAAAECSQISDFSDLALIGDAGDFTDISFASESAGCSEPRWRPRLRLQARQHTVAVIRL